jgi:muramidase (phage lysozyme)
MGWFDSGDAGSLYGDVLTPEQRSALGARGLLGFLGGLTNSGSLDYTMPTITGKLPGGFAKGLAGGMAGMGEAQDAAALNALKAQQVGLQGQDLRSRLQARDALNAALPGIVKMLSEDGDATATPQAAPASSNASATGALASPAIDEVTAGDEPEWRAFAQAVAGPESGGKFNVRYSPRGAVEFSDYSKHPNIAEKGPDGPSTAAGAWQIVKSTFDELPGELRGDFQPATQYQAFKYLAKRDYRAMTGRDLDADLKAGNTDLIQRVLGGTWPTIDKAMKAYPKLLANYTNAGTRVADNAAGASAIPELPDTSLDAAGTAPAGRFGNSASATGNGYATAMAPVPQPTGGSAGGNAVPQAAFDPAANPGLLAPLDPRRQAWVKSQIASGAMPPSAATTTPRFASDTPFNPSTAPGPGLFGDLGRPSPGVLKSEIPQPLGNMRQPGVPPLINIPGVPVPVPGPLPTAANKQALALALLGSSAATAGLGDTVKPLETYFYNSPAYKGQVAGAEKWAGVAPGLFEKWNSPVAVRPGGGQMVGGQVVGSMPQLRRVVNPDTGREEYQYMSPTAGGPTAPGVVGGPVGVAKLSPYELQAGTTRAEKEQAD